MRSISNSSLSNLIVLATLSSSVVSLPYEDFTSPIPDSKTDYSRQMMSGDWKDNAFVESTDYSIKNDVAERIQTILNFSKNVSYNSKDLDSEFIDIVNEHFWELI